MKTTLKLVGFLLNICILAVWCNSQSLSGTIHTVVTIILVLIGIVLLMLLTRTDSIWILNSLMLWGAGLGFIIGLSMMYLVETANHKGSGILPGQEDENGKYYPAEKVSEDQYKRANFPDYGIMLGIGVLLWVWVATKKRNEVAEAKAKEDYLKAQIKASSAFHRAFASAIDETSCAPPLKRSCPPNIKMPKRPRIICGMFIASLSKTSRAIPTKN
ncbi:MAG TPA: hypothetical protein VE344_05545 [Methylomirabilota bacterium]|nr:hypothetical protein [Methylomirabilota bacterium]